MGLTQYHKKRDFRKTAEPKGKKGKSGKEKLRFVVQKHDASRLHFDFRLELDGVLVSWAVPKGPSMKPNEKHLAIKVEDHPLDYRSFEGTIPKGNYGAGTVMVWDCGTYHPHTTDNKYVREKILREELKNGTMKIVLEGEKLKGTFSLVRIDEEKDQWLLFKIKDDFSDQRTDNWDLSVKTGRTLAEIAGETKKITKNESSGTLRLADRKKAKKKTHPGRIKPMLARLSEDPFDDDHWLFEIKYDGYRAIADVQEGKVNLYSRNGKSFNKKFEPIVAALTHFPHEAILDGEVVVLNKEGISRFEWLQNYESDIKGQLVFMVFDLLYLNGFDTTRLALTERKELLKEALPDLDYIRYSDHIRGKGKSFFRQAEKHGLEGIIAKKADSIYLPATRATTWLKIKTIQTEEAVIIGYTQPGGGRKYFGSLLVADYTDGELKYKGRVGTGFSDDTLQSLHKQLQALQTDKAPLSTKDIPQSSRVTWVNPELLAQLKYSEKTTQGIMRHPVFLGLREDKTLQDMKNDSQPNTAAPLTEITNKDKVFWPELGLTKGDVIEFYEKMAEYILPHLKDRPQSLRRNPDGIKDAGFFQKDVGGKIPDWIETVDIYSESNEEEITYMLCQDQETLLFMANWGSIELNSWNSRQQQLDHPDYFVIDLDPGDVPFSEVRRIALVFKDLLDELGATPFVKTSGGRGLHIYVPTGAKYTHEQAQQFIKLLSMHVHEREPEITSLERSPSKRKKQIYLDYLQNGRGKTMVSPYCLRPKPGAPVSTPLHWEEVKKNFEPKDYNLKNIFRRLGQTGDIWKDILEHDFDMHQALERLGNR